MRKEKDVNEKFSQALREKEIKKTFVIIEENI